MSDRTLSLFLILLVLGYGVLAIRLQVPFSYDPLGPKPVPLFLAASLALLLLVLLLHPLKISLPDSSSPTRCGWLLLALVFYWASWAYLGFLISTTISIYLISRLFRCSWMQGLMVALLLSVICYGLFHFLLNVPLPLGVIFTSS